MLLQIRQLTVGKGQIMNQYEREKILHQIERAWAKCPELRLGQLIVNAAARYSDVPLFYIEDESLAGCCEELAKIVNGKGSK